MSRSNNHYHHLNKPNLAARAIELREQGFKATEVAEMLGVSLKTLYRRYKVRFRVALPTDIIIDLYENEGLSCQTIATRFNSSRSRILSILRRCGIKRRNGGGRMPYERQNAIRQMLIDGHKGTFVANTMGVSKAYVYTMRKKLIEQGKLNVSSQQTPPQRYEKARRASGS